MQEKLLVKILLGFILAAFVLTFFYLFSGKKTTQKIEIEDKENKIERSDLKVGYITDVHCYTKYDKDEKIWKFNWRCQQPLENFVQKMNNEFYPDFVIEGGDLVDGRDKRENEVYVEAKKFFEQLALPYYHVLGNHETRGFLKERWLEITGYEKPYYYFDVREYRMIVLDGNNKVDVDGNEFNTTPDDQYYPGYIDRRQMDWLKELLENSEDKIKLVFVHQPPVESTTIKPPGLLFTNGDQLREIFSEYGVLAVFSGHIEEMCSLESGGVNYYVLKGVHKNNRQLPEEHRYKDKGIFYEIMVSKNNEIEIKMFYKDKEDEEYQTLMISPEKVICNNDTVLKPDEYKKIPVNTEESEGNDENDDKAEDKIDDENDDK